MLRSWKALALGLISFAYLSLAPQAQAAFECTLSKTVTVTAAATTEIVPLFAGRSVHVCGFTITQATAGSAKFVYGTGSNCGTGTTDLTAAMVMPTNGSISNAAGQGSLFRTAVSNALCLTAATGNITGFINYAMR